MAGLASAADLSAELTLNSTRDLPGVESRECPAKVSAFPQNRVPAQTGLHALEDQELEQPPVVVHRGPPLTVMVAKRKIIVGPGATDYFALFFGCHGAFTGGESSYIIILHDG